MFFNIYVMFQKKDLGYLANLITSTFNNGLRYKASNYVFFFFLV